MWTKCKVQLCLPIFNYSTSVLFHKNNASLFFREFSDKKINDTNLLYLITACLHVHGFKFTDVLTGLLCGCGQRGAPD